MHASYTSAKAELVKTALS